jgi:hypothetical protein
MVSFVLGLVLLASIASLLWAMTRRSRTAELRQVAAFSRQELRDELAQEPLRALVERVREEVARHGWAAPDAVPADEAALLAWIEGIAAREAGTDAFREVGGLGDVLVVLRAKRLGPQGKPGSGDVWEPPR